MSGSLSPENLQLAAPLRSIPDALKRFGINPAEVLAAAGLSAAALDNPEATIPYQGMGLLLEAAAGKAHTLASRPANMFRPCALVWSGS
jgi:hypothetical protein